MTNRGKVQFITDPRPALSVVDQVDLACKAGIDWIQLRMKDADRLEKLHAGEKIAAIARSCNAVFIVNDDVELAAELGADGVHLGLDDGDPVAARRILGEKAIIGGTCNSFADIRLRHAEGVDYIGLGPYRFTTTKKKLSPVLGLQGIAGIMSRCRMEGIVIPIVAIGGIRVEDISPLLRTGIHGIALSSLIVDAFVSHKTIKKIQEQLP